MIPEQKISNLIAFMRLQDIYEQKSPTLIAFMSDCETKLSGSTSPVGVTLIACQD